jgi:NAD(P)-dependent dehydrogenase (short-subunit alcohol dehydrogenase family)
MSASPSRTILITGVTRGLGRAMAEEFIRRGHRVAGCGRNGAAIRELSASYGAPHRFDGVDVTDDVAVAAWAEVVLAEMGARTCCSTMQQCSPDQPQRASVAACRRRSTMPW